MQAQPAVREEGGEGEEARLEVVGRHRVIAAGHPATVDGEVVGPHSSHMHTQHLQARAEVLHMRLRCGEVDGRAPRDEGGGEEEILRRGDGELGEDDLSGLETTDEVDDLLGAAIFRSQLDERIEVGMDRPLADHAPTGVRHPHLTEAREQRTQEQNGGPEALHEIVGDLAGSQCSGTDVDGACRKRGLYS